MAIDDKVFKEMFLEPLTTSVQTILAFGSGDLDVSKLAEMANRMMKVVRLSSTTAAQVSQPLTASTTDLVELKTQIAQLLTTVATSQMRRSASPSRGCTRIRTTACHTTVNGMVERFHRQLKAPLRAAADPANWTDHLLLVVLRIRSTLTPDLNCSAVKLVSGATVRLTDKMISPTPRVAVEDPTNLQHRLPQFMRTLFPVPSRTSVSLFFSRRTWQRALTSTFDVIESTGHSGSFLEGRRHSTLNALIVRRS
ncbi:hypothetical protein SprV_0200570700 [Sparganum proliferum]